MIVKFWKRYRLRMIGIVVGAAVGYLYWMYIGCQSGSCPLLSTQLNSSLWGAVLGGVLFDLFKPKKKI